MMQDVEMQKVFDSILDGLYPGITKLDNLVAIRADEVIMLLVAE
jgi:hypothetical protein